MVERAGKKQKEKSNGISRRRRFSRIGPQIQKVPVTKPSPILLFPQLVENGNLATYSQMGSGSTRDWKTNFKKNNYRFNT
jgi:hypothetical protein